MCPDNERPTPGVLQHLEGMNPEAVGFNITMAKGTPLIYVCGPQLDGHYFNFN